LRFSITSIHIWIARGIGVWQGIVAEAFSSANNYALRRFSSSLCSLEGTKPFGRALVCAQTIRHSFKKEHLWEGSHHVLEGSRP
jgi:hypothetical protein